MCISVSESQIAVQFALLPTVFFELEMLFEAFESPLQMVLNNII